jgi:hypothetical protein
MQKKRNFKIGAVIMTVLLLGSMLFLPVSGMITGYVSTNQHASSAPLTLTSVDRQHPNEPISQDTIYMPEEETLLLDEQNDIGYNIDAGDRILKSMPVYISEPIEESTPGRGRTGTLDPNNGDEADWYTFTACEGQSFSATVSSGFSYEFADTTGNSVGQTVTADITGRYFFQVFSDTTAGQYTFDIIISGQNDAGTGGDAGNSISAATPITPGSYSGYLTNVDVEDWYSFSASSGQGIFVTLEPLEKSDFDVYLYNPSGELVHYETYYGDDELEYPADDTGTWKIKIDIFPGWDESKWPDNYFLYGSGAYELELSIGGTAESPPGSIPQPDITPIATTYKVIYDDESARDEYAYLAAIPAANYIENNERYVSPIVYEDCDINTLYYTDVDQTTQYLLDDWNTYLSRHGMSAEIYDLPLDPIEAAAGIATDRWDSSDTVVVVPDGSEFVDDEERLIEQTTSIQTTTDVQTLSSDDDKLQGSMGLPVFFNGDVCAVSLKAFDVTISGTDPGVTLISNIFPRYISQASDWWPVPYDSTGDATDLYFPITQKGLWTIDTELSPSQFSRMEIM